MGKEHLVGFSMMEDARTNIILGNHLEVFADATQAGFVVGPLDDPGARQHMLYSSPRMVSHIRNLVDLMRETAGLPVIEPSAEPKPDCPVCHGSGYWQDGDGNQRDCGSCLP